MGIKLIYYRVEKGQFSFGSEIGALLQPMASSEVIRSR